MQHKTITHTQNLENREKRERWLCNVVICVSGSVLSLQILSVHQNPNTFLDHRDTGSEPGLDLLDGLVERERERERGGGGGGGGRSRVIYVQRNFVYEHCYSKILWKKTIHVSCLNQKKNDRVYNTKFCRYHKYSRHTSSMSWLCLRDFLAFMTLTMAAWMCIFLSSCTAACVISTS